MMNQQMSDITKKVVLTHSAMMSQQLSDKSTVVGHYKEGRSHTQRSGNDESTVVGYYEEGCSHTQRLGDDESTVVGHYEE
eukprot:10225377-Ditylum_brightwellii.AAC.1